MAKYLLQGNYVGEGIKGLMKEGGSSRRAAIRALVESVGGKLESVYYALGKTDIFVVVDLPDHATATATDPPASRVFSICWTASAPSGTGAPVMIRTACPA